MNLDQKITTCMGIIKAEVLVCILPFFPQYICQKSLIKFITIVEHSQETEDLISVDSTVVLFVPISISKNHLL